MSSSGDKTEKQKRLTPAEWERIVALYEGGDHTHADLAAQFGISEGSIQRGLSLRGAVKGRNAPTAGDEVKQKMKEEAEALAAMIMPMKQRHLKFGDVITSMTMKRLAEAEKGNIPLATLKGDMIVLNHASKIIGKVRDEAWHIHDLYREAPDDVEVDELNIGEYTASEMDKIRTDGEDPKLVAEMEDEVNQIIKDAGL